MSGFFSEPTDRYPPRKNEIEEKKRWGNFWGENGAIADTKELAYLALCRFYISDALWLMIDVHTDAKTYALMCAQSFDVVFGEHHDNIFWRKRYECSDRIVRRYLVAWKILSVFSRMPA